MFRGEVISLYLKGDKQFNLQEVDFNVYIYPDGDIRPDFLKKTKADCKVQDDGSFLLTIDATTTSSMPLTSYTIEINDASNNVVYKQQNAFSLEPSATAMDILNSIDNGSESEQ